ncbi:oocyte-secreted protein 2 [Mustela putorius furo]|uniref:Oocyte-secreted protein 2 n=1 Tax=Mustela putorius furo TaxID=9669 RepID=A0A8U0T8Y2_MUSPF|nr:oocyte-secreted protein 2 [Mustela putorius furo]
MILCCTSLPAPIPSADSKSEVRDDQREDRNLYFLKIVINKGIQDVFVQTSLPARIPYNLWLVKVSCSMDWLMISVSPCGYSSNLYIFADELYLGSGCPVTRIQTYAYDFIYPVYDCGIRIKVVSEDTLLFQTEMYFNPRNLHCDPQKIPLECSASRKSVWLTPVSTENEIKLDPSPFIADFETTPEELGLLSP